MASNICSNCWRDKHETQQICTFCEKQFTNNLKWLQSNIRNLEDYATKRVGNRNEHTNNAYHASEPIRLTAFNLIYGKNDETGHQGLDITLRCFCACLGTQYTDLDTPYDLTRKILRANFLTNPSTSVYAKEIHRLKKKSETFLTFDHTEQEILGTCPNPECGIQLTVPVNAFEVTCKHCKNKWTVGYLRDQRRTRILNSTHVGTSVELQNLLAQCGINLKRSTVRAWIHRKQLTPATNPKNKPSKPNSKPLYRLADMYKLATGTTNPSEQAANMNI